MQIRIKVKQWLANYKNRYSQREVPGVSVLEIGTSTAVGAQWPGVITLKSLESIKLDKGVNNSLTVHCAPNSDVSPTPTCCAFLLSDNYGPGIWCTLSAGARPPAAGLLSRNQSALTDIVALHCHNK
ncbi:hypothetical protein CBL_06189 [Carabus blaptoides fortunei]